ncbi:hypothetical protein GLYMA_11G039501v4 [Glycine max]|nr:hypothetical protein GLYMA_11G039501v4 [Glycine max]
MGMMLSDFLGWSLIPSCLLMTNLEMEEFGIT